MESCSLIQIQSKIETLVELLSETTPLQALDQHPLDANSEITNSIILAIDTAISEALLKKQNLVFEAEEILSKIRKYSQQLDLGEIELKSIENVYLYKEYLQGELSKVMVTRNKLESEIKVLLDRIVLLSEDLDIISIVKCDENHTNQLDNTKSDQKELNKAKAESKILKDFYLQYKNNQNLSEYLDVTPATLSYLKSIYIEVEREINRMESKRQYFYDQIAWYASELEASIDFSYNEKISDLKQSCENYRKIYEEKNAMFTKLLDEIRTTESILNLPSQEIIPSLSEKNIKLVQEYNSFLKAEQSRLFDEIYDRTLENLKSITSLMNVSFPEYARTDSDLIEMRAMVEKYKNIFIKHSEISDLIQKRKELLLKMTEFEKIASDPKRLFKSSFQLISEEKFRNSAYPSLLKIEENLLNQIDQFEQNYGTFYVENKPYRSMLKYEIENSTINRTVFRSRCDSPYRKRK